MEYLRQDDRMNLLGLFRRAASKARVEILREVAEANPGTAMQYVIKGACMLLGGGASKAQEM